MNEHEHIIGIFHNYDDTDIVTFDELQELVQHEHDYYEWKITHGFPEAKDRTLSDYCDRRKATALFRFNYCPYCGEKIDWKALKEEAKNIQEKRGSKK